MNDINLQTDPLAVALDALKKALGPISSRESPFPVEPELCAMTLCAPMVRGLIAGQVDADYLIGLYNRTMVPKFGKPADVLLRLPLMLDAVLTLLDESRRAGMVDLGPEGLPMFSPSLPIVAAVCRPPKDSGFVKFNARQLLEAALRHARGEDVISELLDASLQAQVVMH